jgi:GNAT superfamily N-acetyltransferase
MTVRDADPSEARQLAQVWYDAWQDSHVRLVPAELAAHRTPESFHERVEAAITRTRAAGALGAPVGLCIIKQDELEQLFVAAAARGTGAAAALLADGEERLRRGGTRLAWLACAIGNDRAARFYEKHGWTRAGVMTYQAVTASATFPLETWRYEKAL